ncbi:MAG: ribonuclease J [Acholeplasmatales bacterium]|nr:MAG: ribonuclease J [Acholeplasmatales bacterium]
MSHIKFFALGGLGEDGKNMYCLEIDGDLFILDAGLKYPTQELYGVDVILPDFSYLRENKKRLRALFLSHGHEDHIGAVPSLLRQFDLPVYGSYFTLALLKDSLVEAGMDPNAYQLNVVTKQDRITFGKTSISFYQSTHSVPESFGIVMQTPDGAIVYSPDYTFDQNVSRAYKTSFERLAEVAGKEVLAWLTESLGAERYGHSHTSRNLDHALNQAFFKAEKRVIVSAFSTDIFRIQKVIDVALKYERDIAIIGRKTQRMVDIAINLGYLRIPDDKLINLKFISEHNTNDLDNALVLVTGERHEPFHMLQRMVRKLDRLIHMKETDQVILMTPPVPGTERIAARTLDILYRNDIHIVNIDKNVLPPSHASSEDIKLLANILNPKYIIPVVGEHRHLFALKKLALSIGYDASHIKVLDNGQVLEFIDGEAKKDTYSINSGDVLIDGILEGDISDIVLRDREILAQDGVLMIVANVDSKNKTFVGEIEIVSRGFVYMRENEPLMLEVAEVVDKSAKEFFKAKYIDWRAMKDKLRDDVARHLYHATNRRPIVISVLIDTPSRKSV